MKRHINILIEKSNKKEIDKIKAYCEKEKLLFQYRYERNDCRNEFERDGEVIAPLYYFSIFGDTNDFNTLNHFVEDKLILTDNSPLMNIVDMDDEFEKNFEEMYKLMVKNAKIQSEVNRNFLDLIMPIKNIEFLENLQKYYSAYMSDTQKRTLKDRLDILKGERYKIDEEWKNMIESLHVDVKELRLLTGMNRKQFAEYFGIPYRTVEDWENKKSTCAVYLFKLMKEKLVLDNLINSERIYK